MKAIKSLAVVSALGIASTAGAATVGTYDVSNAVTISGVATGSFTETGTAVLDDLGTLTIDKSGLNSTNNGNFFLTSRIVWSGTYDSLTNTLAVTSGTVTNLTCTPGTSACSASLQLGVAQTLSVTPNPTTNSGGGLPTPSTFDGTLGGAYRADVWQFAGNLHTKSVTTFTPSAVPVPAAAWLFGSGLLGLAGTARRRRAAA